MEVRCRLSEVIVERELHQTRSCTKMGRPRLQASDTHVYNNTIQSSFTRLESHYDNKNENKDTDNGG